MERTSPRSWRREDFPEARLLRAISSMKGDDFFHSGPTGEAKAYNESVARCIRAEQSRNLGPRVVTISDSLFLGKNIDTVTVGI